MKHHHEDRPERAALDWVNNPSAPHTEADEAFFIAEDREAKLAELDRLLDQLDSDQGKEASYV